MREADLTEWLGSPETRVLVHYLRRQQAAVVQTFLAGVPVDPVRQGKAAALRELEILLQQPEKLHEAFKQALKETT